jgi:hypothetical protein
MYHFQGLALSKQRSPRESPNDSSLTQETGSLSTSSELKSGCVPKAHEETCPVCQEKLSNQKMVFQCGHVTCCKCKSSSLVHMHYSFFFINKQAKKFIKSVKAPLSIQKVYKKDTKTVKKREEMKNTRKTHQKRVVRCKILQ